jgi:hypothetical protein
VPDPLVTCKTPTPGRQINKDGREGPETVDVYVSSIFDNRPKSYGVVVDGQHCWIPKSQIVDKYRDDQHGGYWFEVYFWWARMAKLKGYV